MLTRTKSWLLPAAAREKQTGEMQPTSPAHPTRSRFLGLFTNVPSRIFLLSAACYTLLTWIYISFLSHAPAPGLFDLAGWLSAIERAWSHNDSYFFLHIAQYGYTTQEYGAFFPLYPLSTHLVAGLLGNQFLLAALVVSWLCTWGSYQWFYRLAEREYGSRLALLALLALVCYPMSLFSFASYSEAIFLLVSIGAVERARAGRPWQAGILAALGMLSRPTGLLLLIPLGWELLRQGGWLNRASFWFDRWRQKARLEAPPHERSEQMQTSMETISRFNGQIPRAHPFRNVLNRQSLAWLSLTLVPLALLGYMLYLKAVTGNALAFLSAEATWNRHFRLPWQTAGLFVLSYQHAWQVKDFTLFLGNTVDLLLVIPLPILVVYLSLRRRIIWPGAALYQLALSAMLLAVPATPGPVLYEVLLSTQRFLLPAFPVFLLLGHLGKARPWLYRVFLLASAVLLALNVLRFLSGSFIG